VSWQRRPFLAAGEEVTENISVAGHHGQVTWFGAGTERAHRWVIDGTGKDGGRATITYTLSPHPPAQIWSASLSMRCRTRCCGLGLVIIRSRMKADSIEALRRLKRLLESSGEIN